MDGCAGVPSRAETTTWGRTVETDRVTDAASARRLLGPQAIVGVTASTPDEALKACRDGASYLGIGTVFATPT